jgi:hypothetical protein
MHTAAHAKSILNKIFLDGPEAAQPKAIAGLKEKIHKQKNIILHGAGNLGRQTLAGLQQLGIEPVAFTENAPVQQRKSIAGLPVLSLQESIQLFGYESLYVITILNSNFSYLRGATKLAQFGLTHIQSFMNLFAAYPSTFLPHYSLDRPETFFSAQNQILTAYELFSDKQSQDEFVRHLQFRLHLDFSVLPMRATETYFPKIYFPLYPLIQDWLILVHLMEIQLNCFCNAHRISLHKYGQLSLTVTIILDSASS